jgi:hypothetical protein
MLGFPRPEKPMRVTRPLILVLAVLAAGCGGRDQSWSREKGPTADAGEQAKVVIRGFTESKKAIVVKFEVINDGDQPLSFPLDIYKGAFVDRDPMHESTKTYLTTGDRRITLYTIEDAGKWDFAGKASQMKALGGGWSSQRISVAPHKLDRLTIKFAPRPYLGSAKAPFTLHLDDLRRGETALKPLAVEVR